MTVNHKVLGSNPCGGAILLTIHAFPSERIISLGKGRPAPLSHQTIENQNELRRGLRHVLDFSLTLTCEIKKGTVSEAVWTMD